MKENLCINYINQVIEKKAQESNQKAVKSSSWAVIEEALFWQDLKDLPNPQASLDDLDEKDFNDADWWDLTKGGAY